MYRIRIHVKARSHQKNGHAEDSDRSMSEIDVSRDRFMALGRGDAASKHFPSRYGTYRNPLVLWTLDLRRFIFALTALILQIEGQVISRQPERISLFIL
jgi:hypothetical protein